MKRRSLVAALPAFVLGSRVRAQEAPAGGPASANGHRYVVMSLISDELVYVGAASMTTGSNINHSRYTRLPLTGAPYDRTAMEVLSGRMPRAESGSTLAFFSVSSREAYADQEDWFDGDKVTLPKSLRETVAKEGAPRLLLLTKIRREALISDGHETVGIGRLCGLGIYQDRATAVSLPGEAVRYALTAPYVYARLSVIDVATWQQIRHHDMQLAKPILASSQTALLGDLQQLLIDGLGNAVDALFTPA
jgi:hypothetical protein